MKRIGIIGGMSYESTLHYYEAINRQVNERAGGLVSADLVLRSVNFEEYYEMMQCGDWEGIGARLCDEVQELWFDECDYIAIATNTMHKVFDAFKKRWRPGMYYGTPPKESLYHPDQPMLIHIGDCVAEKCQEIGAENVLLLGTEFTMTESFMKDRLREHGIACDINRQLDPWEVQRIDHIIFDELCHGKVDPDSKDWLVDVIGEVILEESVSGNPHPGAVVLGCTELDMIIKSGDLPIPIIDSTQAHIDKLVDLCLLD